MEPHSDGFVKRVWLLNPEAELEIDHWTTAGSGAFTPPRRLLEALSSRVDSFSDLTRGDSFFFSMNCEDPSISAAIEPGDVFVGWCPTPSLLQAAQKLGLHGPPAPDMALIAQANDKCQLEAWGAPCLPGRRVLESMDEVDGLEGSVRWRFKRRFGFAGRGQRTLQTPWTVDDRRFLADGLAQGMLVAEPEIDGGTLASLHFLAGRRKTLVGTPCPFRCDRFGAFQEWSKQDVPAPLERRMISSAQRVADGLRAAGYAGPGSLDFLWSQSSGCHAIDLNARFSLGWSRGMGDLREQALQLYCQSP